MNKYVYLILDNGHMVLVGDDSLPPTDAQNLYDTLKSEISKSSTSGVIEFQRSNNGVIYTVSVKASHVTGLQLGEASTNILGL